MKKLLFVIAIVVYLPVHIFCAQEVTKSFVAHGAFGPLDARSGWMKTFCKRFDESVNKNN